MKVGQLLADQLLSPGRRCLLAQSAQMVSIIGVQNASAEAMRILDLCY